MYDYVEEASELFSLTDIYAVDKCKVRNRLGNTMYHLNISPTTPKCHFTVLMYLNVFGGQRMQNILAKADESARSNQVNS